jgi:Rha family phage regulatory protein
MVKKTKRERRTKHSTPDSPAAHATGKDLTLVEAATVKEAKTKKGRRAKRSTPDTSLAHATGKELTLVEVKDAQVITTSLLVAKKFGKRHANVLRDIKNLSCSKQFQQLNFELLVEMKQLPQGGATRVEQYIMTKDGFTFLVMGYTGEQASRFKEDYISAFNRMETQLMDGRLKSANDSSRLADLEKHMHKDTLSILDLEVEMLISKTGEAMKNKMLKMFVEMGNSVLAMQGEVYDKIATIISERQQFLTRHDSGLNNV